MWPIFRHELAHFRGRILAWGVPLAILAAYLTMFYNAYMDSQAAFRKLLQSYPRAMLAFLGDVSNMFAPDGYLTMAFYAYAPIVLGIFVVLAGSSLLVRDEENGVLDLLLSLPVSRTTLFWSRLIAFLTATLLILFVVWIGFLVNLANSGLNVSAWAISLPLLSLLAILLFFGTLALLLSTVMPSRRWAAIITGGFLMADYFVTSLADMDTRLQTIARFSPLHYYQGGFAIDGLKIAWFAGLLACSLLFSLLAWRRFLRRDIRVVGEGSWAALNSFHRTSRGEGS